MQRFSLLGCVVAVGLGRVHEASCEADDGDGGLTSADAESLAGDAKGLSALRQGDQYTRGTVRRGGVAAASLGLAVALLLILGCLAV